MAMIDTLLFILGLLGAISLWRFGAVLGAAALLAFAWWRFGLMGAHAGAWTLGWLCLGAVVGAGWQIRHERRQKAR